MYGTLLGFVAVNQDVVSSGLWHDYVWFLDLYSALVLYKGSVFQG